MPKFDDPNLLVGAEGFSDAGIHHRDKGNCWRELEAVRPSSSADGGFAPFVAETEVIILCIKVFSNKTSFSASPT